MPWKLRESRENERGYISQFAISSFVIMLFIFGLLCLGMCSGSVYVKSAANEAALAYARTLEHDDAVIQANKVMEKGGQIFLTDRLDVSTQVSTPFVRVTVTGYPKITKLFTFINPSITFVAESVMEDYYRNPHAYERR